MDLCRSTCQCYAGVSLRVQRTSDHSSGAPHFVSRDCLLAWHFPGEPHWMTSEHQGHVCLCLLELAFRAGAAVPSLFFYLGFVEQNWSPHALKASPSLPDPSPQTPPPTISLRYTTLFYKVSPFQIQKTLISTNHFTIQRKEGNMGTMDPLAQSYEST